VLALTAGLLLSAAIVAASAPAIAAPASPQDGGSVYIGSRQGNGGTGLFPIYAQTPADPADPGEPELWAYCIEHNVHDLTHIDGTIGDASTYLGANHFTDPAVQSKVFWVLAHSYPALSLSDFGTAAGAPGISRNDAIEATQYAIWRYTELTVDAAWNFETPDSEAAYYYLLAGANASAGTTPDTATVAISAPSATQAAGSLVGPFIVTTNRSTARVSATPAATVTDASGAPVDPNAVVDGQALYLDLRGSTASGSATITATVSGSAVNGHVLSVPTVAGNAATSADHAQSIILVASPTTTTSAEAAAAWKAAPAPAGGTPTPTQSPAVASTTGGTTQQLAATGSTFDSGIVGAALLAILAGLATVVLRRRAHAHR
jgi:TQXA domain-containing protein